MHNHTLENQKLKQELTRYKQILGNIPYIDDSLFKGSYRVVSNLKERDAIPYCYRKYGMKVVVVGSEEDGLFREYILNSENLLNVWKEVIVEVSITEVTEDIVDLVEDYSELAEDLETQRDLNLVLKALILQLQQDIQNVDVPTKTSDLINDGQDGINPYITAQDIPAQTPQVNSDWNSTTGVSEILNKPTKLSDFDNDLPPIDISTKAEKDGSNITDTITWRAALDVYNKSEVNSKFINNTSESLTSIEQPTLVGNVLTLKYVGENGIIQEETVDLSNLATIDIHIEDASYNASTNILTITDTEGVEYNVDLSEFSILTSTNANGITTLTQEGVDKLIVSKVGQTGKFPDLLNKPTTLSGYGITNAMSTSHAANTITSTNINNWNTAFGWGNHATAGYLSAVDLNNYVTLNTAQTITGLKNFSNGFDINTFKYRAFDSTNTVTIGKNVFGTNSNIDNAAIAMGNSIFPNMNLQPYTPDQAGANRGYLGIGSEIFIDYTGATNYRPSHNVHDSWIGIGRFLGKGFLDGTNITLLGTSILHKNDTSYADSLTIIGKGFSNGIKTRANKILDPNRVVTAKNGFNVRNMMYNVVGMGNENWVEDITQSVVIGSNLRPYTYVFNSLVLGHHHANMNFEGTTEQADMYLDSDVIIGMGVGKRSSRHAPSHNLLIGMDYFYETGGAPNANYRPLIEGTFKDAKFQVNGTIVGGFEKLDDDLPYLERVTFESVSLPKGVVYNVSERSFTFDGTQASTSITLHNVPANPNRYVYLEISSSNHTVGSWGYSFYNIVDSGNGPTDNFVARQSFQTVSPTTFILTTEGNFKGTIHIICDYTDVTLRSINPNILLKDSKERKTFEIRTTQDPSIVSMGLNSGKFLTHGGKTLILGNNILSETPAATNNVLVGNNILKFGLNVLNNIIVGNTIGGNNTKLTYSIVIGNDTLQSNFTNTTGRLTIVGHNAGKVLTAGIYNNLFGENAGLSLTTGSNNAFFGSGSGLIKEGSNNTFIGHIAGGNGLTQSTVNNTIVIGANAAPEVPNNTTTIASASNTDNFLYGTTHSNSFKVRGGLATQVMMADGTLKDESSFTNGSVTIPLATSTVVGGRKLFSDTVQSKAATPVSSTASRTYGIQVNADGQMVVNVPWVDTNTVYTHPNSGVTAGTYKSVTVNAAGHVTAGTNPTTLSGYGITDAIKINSSAGLNTYSGVGSTYNATSNNSTWFDYNWAGTGIGGSVINFSGLNGGYAVEIFSNYSDGNYIGFRTRNGDNNTWNPSRQIWHSGNLSEDNINNWNQAFNWGNHAGLYSPINHSHTFASITGKPTTIAGYGITDSYVKTEVDTNIKTAVDNIQVGGRNLALNSKTFIDQNSDWVRNFVLSENLIIGQKYTIRAKFRAIQNPNDFFHINDVNGNNSFDLVKINPLEFGLTFTANAESSELVFVRYPLNSGLWFQFESFKIEKGNKATDWTPAPEDQVTDWNTTDVNSFSFIKNKPTKLSQFTNDVGYLTSMPTHSHSEYVTLSTAQTISGAKTFTKNVVSAGFVKSGGTASQVLMANGTVKELSTIGGSNYTAGSNISITGNDISVVNSPTFSGSVTAPAFYEGSLKSLKKNIKPFEKSGLDLVGDLNIVTFDRKDESAKNKIGIIADDSPKEFLSEELDAVDLYKTVFIQAKAIQELNAKNLELEERLIKLEKLLSNG